jgi:phage-related tail protein
VPRYHQREERQAVALEQRVDRLERALAELAEAQARTERTLSALVERFDRLDDRMGRVEEALARLSEAQVRTEERVGRVEDALARLAEAQARTEEQVRLLVGEVGVLKGDNLERRYRENAAAYFQRVLRGIRLVTKEQVERIADEAEDRGLLSQSEHESLLRADVVVLGRLRESGTETYLLAELSSVVDPDDVQRAVDRTRLLERAAGAPVVAAVAGERITPTARQKAAELNVWRVLDGRAYPPDALDA